MAVEPTTTSRRNLLAGMALALPLASLPFIPACTAKAEASPVAARGAWEAALSNLQRAESAHTAALTAHGAVKEAYFAQRPQRTRGVPCIIGDTTETFNARAATMKADYQRAEEEVCERLGVANSEARAEAACTADCAAFEQMLETPAPDLAAVIQKLEWAAQRGREAGDLGTVLADLRRFAGRAVAHG